MITLNDFYTAVAATWMAAKLTDEGWFQVVDGLYSLAFLAGAAKELELYDDLLFLIDTARLRGGDPLALLQSDTQFTETHVALLEKELSGNIH